MSCGTGVVGVRREPLTHLGVAGVRVVEALSVATPPEHVLGGGLRLGRIG